MERVQLRPKLLPRARLRRSDAIVSTESNPRALRDKHMAMKNKLQFPYKMGTREQLVLDAAYMAQKDRNWFWAGILMECAIVIQELLDEKGTDEAPARAHLQPREGTPRPRLRMR